jgi:aryl-alcohol dehydrogenase-like predicted oxidoreductase
MTHVIFSAAERSASALVDVDQLRRIQQIAPVETLHPQYSLIERDVGRELLPSPRREGIGVIVYSPQLSPNLELVARLTAVADRHDTTPGAVAVAWTLRHPAVDDAIVGFRRPDQVEPILTAAELALTNHDIAEIEGHTQ